MEFGLAVDESRSPYAIVAVTGEVDVATAPSLQEKLAELVLAGKVQLIVDLQGVEFLDSTGLGVLVSTVKRARSADGDLGLVCSNPHLLKVFEITGLSKVFAISETLDAAVADRPGSESG